MTRDTLAYEAHQSFLRHAKVALMSRLFPAVRDKVAAAAAQGLPNDPLEADAVVLERLGDDPGYRFYCWLERYIQFFKYRSRHGLAAEAADPEAPYRAWLAEPGAANLDLAEVDVPAYYAAVDTHQHPGNLHGDDLAGVVYKLSAATTQPGSTDSYGLHYRFADWVAPRIDAPSRIVDLGCGFGKSTLPFAERWPDATVEAVDLSAGCLRLAAREATERGCANITYRQRDALATGYEDGAFDLVTSTMLLHEVDQPTMPDLHRETFRLLAPGGWLVHLDFKGRDAVEAFFLHGHGVRNNEPFMAAQDMDDTAAALSGLGFADVSIVPFAEYDGALAPDNRSWRLPWTVFLARKPAAA